jgi:AraC family transcriptional regulator
MKNLRHIYIKNMVCDRCIKVVKEELEKTGLEVADIKLGEAEVNGEDIQVSKIKEVLEENGFELLENKNVKLIGRVKTLIIELIHHNKSGNTIKENYSEYISRAIGKDYTSISHLFSSIENITIEKYIIHQKVEKVKELLIYDELTLSEISYQLGYSSVGHLSSQFKQVTGMSPSEFKKLKSHTRKSLDQI